VAFILSAPEAEKDVAEALPLLPLEYLIRRKLQRRQATWPVITVAFGPRCGGARLARGSRPVASLTRSGGQGQSSADVGQAISAPGMLLPAGIDRCRRTQW
jgi:hypothetical protein